jgi:sulfatase modifying factor 1
MNHDRDVSRREFIIVASAAAAGITLSACGSPAQDALTPTISAEQSTEIPQQTESAPVEPTMVPIVEPIYPEMITVEPGTFQMGSEEGYRFEKPVHTVTISRPFKIGLTAVTYEEFDKYTEDIQKAPVNLGVTDRGTYPVSGVDWFDAVSYCSWLSEKDGLAPCYSGGGKVTKCDFLANGYRLPTEAEWEYAARGGNRSNGYLFSGSNDPDDIGWHSGNSGGSAHPVGQKAPNELGIYDMSGNRWEWCWDWFDAEYYAISPEIDPTGPLTAPKGSFVNRSRRSSSAGQDVETLRVAFRSYDGVSYPGDNGLRLVKSQP